MHLNNIKVCHVHKTVWIKLKLVMTTKMDFCMMFGPQKCLSYFLDRSKVVWSEDKAFHNSKYIQLSKEWKNIDTITRARATYSMLKLTPIWLKRDKYQFICYLVHNLLSTPEAACFLMTPKAKSLIITSEELHERYLCFQRKMSYITPQQRVEIRH